MASTLIVNVILCIGVIVMVVAPLVWAILTQHRDRPRLATIDAASAPQPQPQSRRRAPQPSYEPAIHRA